MRKVREVLELHLKTGLSLRKIERATGTKRSTVGDYIKRCKEALLIDSNELDNLDDDTLYEKLYPESRTYATSSSKIMPNFEIVHLELKQRKKSEVTLMLLWEEYKEINPTGYEYTQFCVHYNRYKKKLNPSMRQVHIAGDRVFVDYSGITVAIHNAKTGEVEKAQLFVAVLGASGYTFAHASLSQKQEDFINSHVLAYHFFAGIPRAVVPDNLKSAVISNNKKGIVINESYADLARHYNMFVEPTRPYKPKDKAKAEQGVLGIQRYILGRLRKQKFFDINELNDAISTLLDDYNNKIVKHLEKSRTQMFEEIEKQHLQELPANRYLYKQFKMATVNQDYHVSLHKCHYSVPFTYLKERVEIRYSLHYVEIYCKHSLIATHPRKHRIGEVSTLKEHMPAPHQYVSEKMNPDRLRSWAKNIGEFSSIFVEDVFASVENPPNAYSQIIAVLSLAKSYGQSELELALMYAVKERTLKTKSIKSILEKKLYLSKSVNNTLEFSISIADPTIFRGADEYK
jgi:transposase